MEIAMWDKARAFERIHKIVDPDCKLSLIEIVKLVKEKFTSTNSAMLQCLACGSDKVNIIHQCEKCKAESDISNWRDRKARVPQR